MDVLSYCDMLGNQLVAWKAKIYDVIRIVDTISDLDKEKFYRSIYKVQSVIEKRSNMPILSMILITASDSTIDITATDLEISFRQKIPAEVAEPGSITISGRKA